MEQKVRIAYTLKFNHTITWDINYNDDTQEPEEEIADDIEKHPNDYMDGNITDIELTYLEW
ncbi:hypothetical protein ACUW9N_002191 [Staphylococcus auricularis]|uniref:Phage protein n=1 Tax=Staphylococcus auricularis TaxID=29379 RepID=A0AAW7MAF4_9STAP|nr:hypothetical protein [Staphylococcus auricularis]MBM0868928.1 hypothetical protein [Staphylococcus auricularis]MCG7342360.1 hypothetical protein [Staphylococcus auricularis]MDC6328243.1 hypothetical protein [Staphylococcus auricularis]MDN4532166.1 hypothetical protein [Staphylococcus auricularis]